MTNDTLEFARALVRAGVPVFTTPLVGDKFSPKKSDWQNTQVSAATRELRSWRVGQGMGAVCGHTMDVIDYDPRNDKTGAGARGLRALMERNDPEIFARVQTAHGGWHYWIGSLGRRGGKTSLPGVDYQGQGRFAFIPPTERFGSPYEVASFSGSLPAVCDGLKSVLEREAVPGDGGRSSLDTLERNCVSAEAGDQRPALLAYVHEMERLGWLPDSIVHACIRQVRDMPVYDDRDPWYPARGHRHPDHWIKGLLHRAGTVVADSDADEQRELEELRNGPERNVGLVPVSSLSSERVSWLWPGYLAYHEVTQMDGEKAQGKTFITDDIAARFSRGLPMPGQSRGVSPGKVLIMTDEGHANSVLRPRLEAAGADLDRVFMPPVKVVKGRAPEMYLLPNAAGKIGAMIKSGDIGLIIFDPITDFLGEDINTNNDASVRRALRPFAAELARYECSAWAIRHMNKDKSQDAKFRGGGSAAFQNRARVHLVTGEIPPSSSVPGKFGLAMIDNNLMPRIEGVLSYDIVDSNIQADDDGRMIGMVEWHGVHDIDHNRLTKGDEERRGPDPMVQQEILDVLGDLFSSRDRIPADECKRALKESGTSTNSETVSKARKAMGIRSAAVFKPEGGISHWEWIAGKEKIGGAK